MKVLLTGCAGFIGSHLLKKLLASQIDVIGIDNFITGTQKNLDAVRFRVSRNAWRRFEFIEKDISKIDIWQKKLKEVDTIFHQAALGSVPRSIKSPYLTHRHNVEAFINLLDLARVYKVRRFIFASSSSVYGEKGKALSPYALTKQINENYAELYYRLYGMSIIGLRYFNVFGPRQDPDGDYAAVIPKWLKLIQNDEVCEIYGGSQSRDFTYVDNIVEANLLAADIENKEAFGKTLDIGCGRTTTLKQLHSVLYTVLMRQDCEFIEKPARRGDIKNSIANIDDARRLLGYKPIDSVEQGLEKMVEYSKRQIYL